MSNIVSPASNSSAKGCYRLYAGHGNWINLDQKTTEDLLGIFEKGLPTRYELTTGLYIDIIPNDVDCNSKNIDMLGLMRADLVYDSQIAENQVQQMMSHYIRGLLDDQGIIDAFPPLRSGEELPIITSLPSHRHLSLVPSVAGAVRRGPKPSSSVYKANNNNNPSTTNTTSSSVSTTTSTTSSPPRRTNNNKRKASSTLKRNNNKKNANSSITTAVELTSHQQQIKREQQQQFSDGSIPLYPPTNSTLADSYGSNNNSMFNQNDDSQPWNAYTPTSPQRQSFQFDFSDPTSMEYQQENDGTRQPSPTDILNEYHQRGGFQLVDNGNHHSEIYMPAQQQQQRWNTDEEHPHDTQYFKSAPMTTLRMDRLMLGNNTSETLLLSHVDSP